MSARRKRDLDDVQGMSDERGRRLLRHGLLERAEERSELLVVAIGVDQDVVQQGFELGVGPPHATKVRGREPHMMLPQRTALVQLASR